MKVLLGIYLGFSAVLACIFLMLPGTALLPLKDTEATCAFMIIAPVLTTVIMAFIQHLRRGDQPTETPASVVWVVKAGGLAVAGILLFALVGLSLGSFESTASLAIAPANFLAGVSFAATLLNLLLQVPSLR